MSPEKPRRYWLSDQGLSSKPDSTAVEALMSTSATVGRLLACCARAASGHAIAALPTSVRNSRRLIAAEAQDKALCLAQSSTPEKSRVASGGDPLGPAPMSLGVIRDRVKPAAGPAMSALAPFATKNGTLPKRQARPARATACAHGKKVLAYEAE
jgi:hypothetical protein